MSEITRALARLRVPLGFACAIVVFWLATPTRASLMWGGTLADGVEGAVLRPEDEGYAEEVAAFNVSRQHTPEVVVVPRSADVSPVGATEPRCGSLMAH